MRRIAGLSMVSLMVALMVVQPVSADLLVTEVLDADGDVPCFFDSVTGEAMPKPTNGNQQWCSYGYFDMTAYSLSKDLQSNMFTFGMTVAADFPEPGDILPIGVERIDWLIWFDREPYNRILSPEVTTEYQLNLTFDGMGYSCSFCDYVILAGDVIETLAPSVEGNLFTTSFSGDLVGDISDDANVEFYWIVAIRVAHGGYYSCLFADWTDWDVADGQILDSIPWPAPVEP